MTVTAGIAILRATMCAQDTGLTRMERVDTDADDDPAQSAIRMAQGNNRVLSPGSI